MNKFCINVFVLCYVMVRILIINLLLDTMLVLHEDVKIVVHPQEKLYRCMCYDVVEGEKAFAIPY